MRVIQRMFKTFLMLQVVVAFSFMSFAQAKSSKEYFNKQWFEGINEGWSLEKSFAMLKFHYKTSEDQKHLNELYSELAKIKKPGTFKPDSEGAAYWMGDQKVFVLNDYGPDFLEINGQKVSMSKGESFLKFRTDFLKVAQWKKSSSLEKMFIQEAHAIAPLAFILLGGATVGGIVHAQNYAKTPEGQAARVAFKNNGSKCNSYRRSSPARRMRTVKKNFRSNGPFNQMACTASRACDEKFVLKYQRMGLARPNAVQIAKCIDRKMKPCDQQGWNMTQVGAEAICTAGFCEWSRGKGSVCQGVVVTPTVPTPPPGMPQPPTYCGKTRGQCGGQVTVDIPQQPVMPQPDTHCPKVDR